MKVLIIGGGGREHALAWQCAKSNEVANVYVAPGNAGTQLENKLKNIDIATDNISALVDFARGKKIDLTIVGPEQPLVMGVVDAFYQAQLNIFAPTQAAAQLEGSKAFCKDFLARNHIPTAFYAVFTEVAPAVTYVQKKGTPIVIKADGLAAGKGVIIAHSQQEATGAIIDMLSGNRFGDAGYKIVIEEFLVGDELSFIVMADGRNILPMATSQDHKARGEFIKNNRGEKAIGRGNKGTNTGGMGAYSPVLMFNPSIYQTVIKTIIKPTITAMANEGMPYTGFLYAGLMIDKDGNARVLEYNCRLGDPEAQPLMMRLKSDLVPLCLLATQGRLDEAHIEWDSRVSLGVVLAAKGYPNKYISGEVVQLPPDIEDKKIFHAGTKKQGNKITSSGGRVLCATALGVSMRDAQNKAYELVQQIDWNGAYYRDDIGFKAIV